MFKVSSYSIFILNQRTVPIGVIAVVCYCCTVFFYFSQTVLFVIVIG